MKIFFPVHNVNDDGVDIVSVDNDDECSYHHHTSATIIIVIIIIIIHQGVMNRTNETTKQILFLSPSSSPAHLTMINT